jgi:acetyltransferase-like isoleucine patch superfamily enzyme
MLNWRYGVLALRYAYWKLRLGKRLVYDGPAFIGRGVRIQVGRGATLKLGRWSWVGGGSKLRVHEGRCEIGSKTVMGEECTISAYREVVIGRECLIADRAMFIDFDHNVTEVERPIRAQGIYSRPVRVGHNVWVGYGACVLRGATVGDNSVLGTYAVVTRGVPANTIAAGAPARVVRERGAPETLRWQ